MPSFAKIKFYQNVKPKRVKPNFTKRYRKTYPNKIDRQTNVKRPSLNCELVSFGQLFTDVQKLLQNDWLTDQM